jgi:peroxiredoxin
VGTISSAERELERELRREMTIDIGQNVPDFRLADENEREVALPATGEPTVLIFYRGDW